MRPGKLITLLVLGFLAWEHQALLADKARLARHLPDIANTYMEMRSFRVPLIRYMDDNDGRAPRDLPSWLRRHFDNPAKEDPAVDHFGRPYRVEAGRFRETTLRSCGPDRACRTEDDLVVRF